MTPLRPSEVTALRSLSDGSDHVGSARIWRALGPATEGWTPGSAPTQVIPELLGPDDIIVVRHHGLYPTLDTELLPYFKPVRSREEYELGMSSLVAQSRWARLGHEFGQRLNPAEQAAVLSWASFTAMFTGLRLLTHWIHRGHGPKGGGISVGGRHFHHYNIGIALLSAVGAVGLRGSDERRQHPAVAVAYGTANALVVDELALLLDLKDVYWSQDGRESVDVAIGVIALGATISAGMPLWPHARRALHDRHTPTLKG